MCTGNRSLIHSVLSSHTIQLPSHIMASGPSLSREDYRTYWELAFDNAVKQIPNMARVFKQTSEPHSVDALSIASDQTALVDAPGTVNVSHNIDDPTTSSSHSVGNKTLARLRCEYKIRKTQTDYEYDYFHARGVPAGNA